MGQFQANDHAMHPTCRNGMSGFTRSFLTFLFASKDSHA